MIEHIWTVACTRSVIDKETNNFSLLEILEQLTIPESPLPEGKITLIPISFDVVTLWSRASDNQAARGSAKLLFITPSGKIVGEHEHNVDLTVYSRARTRTRMAGLPIQEAGRYQFRVQLRHDGETEWRDVATVPLQISFDPVEG